jgi:small subunit ribosomal protein S11
MGFKGARKSTPFAAQVTAESVAKKAMDNGLRTVEVTVKGPVSEESRLSEHYKQLV